MSKAPINQKATFERKEVPQRKQDIFTGLLSGAGQIVVPAELRKGETNDMPIPAGSLVEVKLIAIHYPEE